MQKLKQKLFIILFAIILVNPVVAFAQNTNTSGVSVVNNSPTYQGVEKSLEEYLCVPGSNDDGHALERCVNKIYRFGISFGAIALVFFIVFAGYLYITGGEQSKTRGKEIFFNSLTGMAILLLSYVILRFINPNLVVYRPIQPPIFTAEDLPSCDEIGLGDRDCIVDTEDSVAVTTTRGAYAECPNGLVAFEKNVVPVNAGNDTEQVCKAMMEKLKAIHAKTKITVTATIGPGHDSNCHKSGTPVSGVCADMGPQNGNYEALCTAIKEVGGLAILNESGKSGSQCGTFVKTRKWSGAHLHVWLKK